MSVSSNSLTWPLIQIAGVMDLTEATMLHDAGCRCLGFPLRLPVNAADMSEDAAAKLIRQLPTDVTATLICYEDKAEEIARFTDFLGVRCVQLHGPVHPRELAELKRCRPSLFVIKSLIVRPGNTGELLAQLEEEAPLTDAFITDSHDPNTGADGATGQTHDWNVSHTLVIHSPKPIILAGGLNPSNVAAAIAAVTPAGVDVHTGIEDADGRKSPKAVRSFIANALAAFKSHGVYSCASR